VTSSSPEADFGAERLRLTQLFANALAENASASTTVSTMVRRSRM
jgi:hypothetical protein